jgi:hypothetical protein
MLKLNKKTIGLGGLLIGVAVIIPNLVFAKGYLLQGISCINDGNCTFCDVGRLISNIFNILRNDIAFPLAILMVVYGGALMIFSGGDSKRVGNGRKTLMAALVGLAIVVGVSLILNTVIMLVTKQTSWQAFVNGKIDCINFNGSSNSGGATASW